MIVPNTPNAHLCRCPMNRSRVLSRTEYPSAIMYHRIPLGLQRPLGNLTLRRQGKMKKWLLVGVNGLVQTDIYPIGLAVVAGKSACPSRS